jgi:hypothetical protein
MPQDHKDKNLQKPNIAPPNLEGLNLSGRTPIQNAGQSKPQGFTEQKGVTWTNEEIETLKQLAQQHTPVDEICSELGKSEDVIEAKARELKLTLA